MPNKLFRIVIRLNSTNELVTFYGSQDEVEQFRRDILMQPGFSGYSNVEQKTYIPEEDYIEALYSKRK